MSNVQTAERIRADGIHVLVDLHGYTQNGRAEIFALRPAPVQISYLAFPGSLGGLLWDYLIADTTVLPPEQQAIYLEKAIYLPDCYQPNDNQQALATTGRTRAQEGLPEAAFVFCCHNEAKKLDPHRFDLWLKLLQQVPDSVLWLYGAQARLHENLRARATALGVAPERLVFARRRTKADHLERLALADLFLDTASYNAHTTASDALWAGLPLLTCPGEYFPARVAASILKAMDMAELIAPTPEAYYTLALALATDKPRLAQLRQRLAAQRSTTALFDTQRYTRHLETGYRMAWERYQRGLAAEVIYVPGGK
jgi:predicted O-linked N-acetylglucosamine transferase (SPINDLY family)